MDRKQRNKEYYDNNKDSIKNKARERYNSDIDANREYYRNYNLNKGIILCDCGKEVRQVYLERHKLTSYHIKKMENIADSIN
jgi:hypothetical protein